MSEIRIGDRIHIINMIDEPDYAGREGIVELIDGAGQLHGTWGSLAVIPEEDEFEILQNDLNESIFHETFKFDESIQKGDIQGIVDNIVDRINNNLKDSNDNPTEVEFEIPTINKKEINTIFELLGRELYNDYINYEITDEETYSNCKYYVAKITRSYPDDYYFDYESEETTQATEPGQRTGKYKKEVVENMNTDKEQLLKTMAYEDVENDQVFDEDDFDVFQEMMADQGYQITRADLDTYYKFVNEANGNSLNESKEDETSDIILEIHEDETSDFPYTDEYQADAHFAELEQMTDPDLNGRGIIGYARLMKDDEGNFFLADERYACDDSQIQLVDTAVDEFLASKLNENLSQEDKTCVICGKDYDGYGNNAEPVADGKCCDDCNIKIVIPARLKQMKGLKESSDQGYELDVIVKDSIHHLVNDLGKDPDAEDFADDVVADIEDNYDSIAPDDFNKYQDWVSQIMQEVSRQLNTNLDESLTHTDYEYSVALEDEDEDRKFFNTYEQAYEFAERLAKDHEIRSEFNCDVCIYQTDNDWSSCRKVACIEIEPLNESLPLSTNPTKARPLDFDEIINVMLDTISAAGGEHWEDIDFNTMTVATPKSVKISELGSMINDGLRKQGFITAINNKYKTLFDIVDPKDNFYIYVSISKNRENTSSSKSFFDITTMEVDGLDVYGPVNESSKKQLIKDNQVKDRINDAHDSNEDSLDNEQGALKELFGFGKKKSKNNRYIAAIFRDRSGCLATADLSSKLYLIIRKYANFVEDSNRKHFSEYTLDQYEFVTTIDKYYKIQDELNEFISNLPSRYFSGPYSDDISDSLHNLFGFDCLETGVKESIDSKERKELTEGDGNTITRTLPPSIDKFLMDMSQMYIDDLSYTDISKFGDRATEEDINQLKKYKRELSQGFEDDDPEIQEIFKNIKQIVKGNLTEAKHLNTDYQKKNIIDYYNKVIDPYGELQSSFDSEEEYKQSLMDQLSDVKYIDEWIDLYNDEPGFVEMLKELKSTLEDDTMLTEGRNVNLDNLDNVIIQEDGTYLLMIDNGGIVFDDKASLDDFIQDCTTIGIFDTDGVKDFVTRFNVEDGGVRRALKNYIAELNSYDDDDLNEGMKGQYVVMGVTTEGQRKYYNADLRDWFDTAEQGTIFTDLDIARDSWSVVTNKGHELPYGFRRVFVPNYTPTENTTKIEESMSEEKWNIGSNKLVQVGSPEYLNLVELAQKLEDNSPNSYYYEVEKTYEDFGANMQWYTIICYDHKGDHWQVLNTKDWLDLANTGDIDTVYNQVISNKYFQDKQKSYDEMNVGEIFDSLDQ